MEGRGGQCSAGGDSAVQSSPWALNEPESPSERPLETQKWAFSSPLVLWYSWCVQLQDKCQGDPGLGSGSLIRPDYNSCSRVGKEDSFPCLQIRERPTGGGLWL